MRNEFCKLIIIYNFKLIEILNQSINTIMVQSHFLINPMTMLLSLVIVSKPGTVDFAFPNV